VEGGRSIAGKIKEDSRVSNKLCGEGVLDISFLGRKIYLYVP
jgi:hypothetical protein